MVKFPVMERATPSMKRGNVSRTRGSPSPGGKKGKLTKTNVGKFHKSLDDKLSRSLKVNKNPKGRNVGKIRPKGPQLKGKRFSQDDNNNAFPDNLEETETVQPGTSGEQDSNVCDENRSFGNDLDHVQVTVNDSEDDLSDDQGNDVDYNQHDSDSDSLEQEANTEYDSGSEVVIAPKKKSQEQEWEDELKQMAKNPTFINVMKGVFKEIAQEAGSSPTRATPRPIDGNITKRVVRNPKSPSDMTIYAPALNLTPDKGPNSLLPRTQVDANKIAEFVENIQLQTAPNNGDPVISEIRTGGGVPNQQVVMPVLGEHTTQPPHEEPQPSGSWRDEARDAAVQMVAETVAMKAKLDGPQGRNMVGYSDVVDYEFFHITCHVDNATRVKIEAGQFEELEKLLVKDRPFSRANADGRMGLYSKDGMTYFAPAAEKEVKISNVRRWEQAFRIYAAIYSNANPHRASEIWQYVHVINSAASSFIWGNVAEYDFTFRQLMAAYPARSWAKTYVQGWNIIMRDHIVRDQVSTPGCNFNKDNICWPFNKGKCTDPSCMKDHKCGYCGRFGHGIFNCRKKKKNNFKHDGESSDGKAAQQTN